jgi:hypothetical protein
VYTYYSSIFGGSCVNFNEVTTQIDRFLDSRQGILRNTDVRTPGEQLHRYYNIAVLENNLLLLPGLCRQEFWQLPIREQL